jgi:hypothetical protein
MKYKEWQKRPVRFLSMTGYTIENFEALYLYFEEAHNEYLRTCKMTGKRRSGQRRYVMYNTPLAELLTLYRMYDAQTSAVTSAESGKASEVINHEFIQFLLSKLDDNEKIKSVLQEQFMSVMKKMADLSFFSSKIYFTFMSEVIEGLYNNGFFNLNEPINKRLTIQ